MKEDVTQMYADS